MIFSQQLPVCPDVNLLVPPPINTIWARRVTCEISELAEIHKIHLLAALVSLLYSMQDAHNNLLDVEVPRDIPFFGIRNNLVTSNSKLLDEGTSHHLFVLAILGRARLTKILLAQGHVHFKHKLFSQIFFSNKL
jgi:hypothetical protein